MLLQPINPKYPYIHEAVKPEVTMMLFQRMQSFLHLYDKRSAATGGVALRFSQSKKTWQFATPFVYELPFDILSWQVCLYVYIYIYICVQPYV